MQNRIGPFEGASREIAARVTELPKKAQPIVRGGIFENIAFVDVVTDKLGNEVPPVALTLS